MSRQDEKIIKDVVEVADLVTFLASEESKYNSGTAMRIDGGQFR